MATQFTPKSISFKGYKCFKEESTIPWFAPFNVIIGRNNSGKSSFIDIIHSLCDASFRASIAKSIEISLSYLIDDHNYFDFKDVIQHYGGYALQAFGYHLMGEELHVSVELRSSLGYINFYDVNPKDLLINNCPLYIKDKVCLDPFKNSVFRCIASERDINPESFFSAEFDVEINPNGVGTTRYICSMLNDKMKNDSIIQYDLLNAFNEILGSDGYYMNIKVKYENGDNWEVVLEDDKNFFPPYYAIPLVRSDTLKEYPEIEKVLNALGPYLTDEVMQDLNYQVDELGKSPEKVATDFLNMINLTV